MNIIKLNAIESTNSYLKDLMQSTSLENYTVVVAENQTHGRGQMGEVWEVEAGKSLTFSVLVWCEDFDIGSQTYFNMCVSLACSKVLKRHVAATIKVKWPNDIMAEKDKIAGILIENTIRGNTVVSSVVGIGINVNQIHFPEHLKGVSSLSQIEKKEFNKEDLMHELLHEIHQQVCEFEKSAFESIKKQYLEALFEFQKPRMFETAFGEQFLGKITDVNSTGQLVVETSDKKTREFGIKEIKFASSKR